MDKTKCCKKEQNQHFEFYDKYLNEVDVVRDFRRKLRNKKLLLIGDSLMIEFFEYLVAFLRTKDPYENFSSLTQKLVSFENKSAVLPTLVTPATNSTVTLLPAHLITLEGQKPFSREVKKSRCPRGRNTQGDLTS